MTKHRSHATGVYFFSRGPTWYSLALVNIESRFRPRADIEIVEWYGFAGDEKHAGYNVSPDVLFDTKKDLIEGIFRS